MCSVKYNVQCLMQKILLYLIVYAYIHLHPIESDLSLYSNNFNNFNDFLYLLFRTIRNTAVDRCNSLSNKTNNLTLHLVLNIWHQHFFSPTPFISPFPCNNISQLNLIKPVRSIFTYSIVSNDRSVFDSAWKFLDIVFISSYHREIVRLLSEHLHSFAGIAEEIEDLWNQMTICSVVFGWLFYRVNTFIHYRGPFL